VIWVTAVGDSRTGSDQAIFRNGGAYGDKPSEKDSRRM
jgi:hypothetical protein